MFADDHVFIYIAKSEYTWLQFICFYAFHIKEYINKSVFP